MLECAYFGRQAYRCGDCQRGYAPGGAYQRPGKVLKAPGIAIYLECGSLSSVRRILGYSTPAVLGWVKKGVSAVNWLRERSAQRTEGAAWREPAAVMAGTEMWTYRGVRRGEKRESWGIGTAAVEETAGRRGVDFEVGDRSANTFERLYARLPETQQYCRDIIFIIIRAAYAAWFPPDCPQAGIGGPVNWNEGLHSFLRSQLNRLVRRTKGYTKSIAMLVYSVALVCQQMAAKPIIHAR